MVCARIYYRLLLLRPCHASIVIVIQSIFGQIDREGKYTTIQYRLRLIGINLATLTTQDHSLLFVSILVLEEIEWN